MKFINITGQKFGRLTAIKFDHKDGKRNFWLFKCSCGKEKIIAKNHVMSGDSGSCGCLAREQSRERTLKCRGNKHPMFGRHHTKDTKIKIQNSLIGKMVGKKNYFFGKYFIGSNNPFFGKHHSKEFIEKMSKLRKGKHLSEETKIKIGLGNKGKICSMETKMKISKGNKGKIFSKEHKQKISKNHANVTLNNNPNWNNGKSFEPYSTEWTKTLKYSIRKRDYYTCRLCGKKSAICVHHIDYNKLNCNLNNLITLCRCCHTKTNYNRNYWIKYFNKDILYETKS